MICPKCGRDLIDGRCTRCDSRHSRRDATQKQPIKRTTTYPSSAVRTAAQSPRAIETGEGLALSSTEPASGDALVGMVIDKRWRITAFVGEGAMGGVYRAQQLGLARDVAIKFIHRHLVDDSARLARFEREALVLSKLEHPNIVTIYDYGLFEQQAFIAMQYLSGGSLELAAKAATRLPLAEVVRIVGEICDALDAAHAAGVVHRDLKPDNVMLVGPQRQVKLVDFGVAKLADSATKLTQDGTMLGTPAYMAPEQCAGEEIGPQTDIYALGVMLYELLTGQLPFHAESLQGLIFKHMLDEAKPPSELEPRVHAALDEVTLWALAKRREARPASGAALKAKLLDAAAQAEGLVSDEHRRKDGSYAKSRAERSAAITAVPASAPRTDAVEGALIVVDPGAASTESPATHLQLAGYALRRVASADTIEPADEKAIVIDLGDDAAAALEQLAPRLAGGRLAGLPVVVVGPDDAMDQMSRALELKLAAYVPRSKLKKRLAKAVRRAVRRS